MELVSVMPDAFLDVPLKSWLRKRVMSQMASPSLFERLCGVGAIARYHSTKGMDLLGEARRWVEDAIQEPIDRALADALIEVDRLHEALKKLDNRRDSCLTWLYRRDDLESFQVLFLAKPPPDGGQGISYRKLEATMARYGAVTSVKQALHYLDQSAKDSKIWKIWDYRNEPRLQKLSELHPDLWWSKLFWIQ